MPWPKLQDLYTIWLRLAMEASNGQCLQIILQNITRHLVDCFTYRECVMEFPSLQSTAVGFYHIFQLRREWVMFCEDYGQNCMSQFSLWIKRFQPLVGLELVYSNWAHVDPTTASQVHFNHVWAQTKYWPGKFSGRETNDSYWPWKKLSKLFKSKMERKFSNSLDFASVMLLAIWHGMQMLNVGLVSRINELQ